MMRLKGRKARGISLLELLMAILIFATAMMAFAAVFPGGYRLTLKNRNESQAAELANGIIEEIMNLPYSGGSALDPSVDILPGWSKGTFATFPTTQIPPPFELPDSTQTPEGIDVQLSPTGTLATIRVTITWTESLKERVITKSVTLFAYRSSNH